MGSILKKRTSIYPTQTMAPQSTRFSLKMILSSRVMVRNLTFEIFLPNGSMLRLVLIFAPIVGLVLNIGCSNPKNSPWINSLSNQTLLPVVSMVVVWMTCSVLPYLVGITKAVNGGSGIMLGAIKLQSKDAKRMHQNMRIMKKKAA